ncbi:MAG: sensor histidine kinase [Bacteroidota bacterium]
MAKWKRSTKSPAANRSRIVWQWWIYLGLLLAPKGTHADTPVLDSLEGLARRYYAVDLDSSRYFARKAAAQGSRIAAHEKVAWAYNWIAITYIKQGLTDSVTVYLDRCLAYCAEHDVPEIAGKARLNQSINLHQRGEYEAAVESGLAALRNFEAEGDDLGVAHAHYNTGMSYQRLDRLDEALAYYRRALPTYREKGGVLDRANTFNAIGSAFNEQERGDSALHYYRQAVEEKLAVNAWAYCGSEYSNIASRLEQDGDSAQAAAFYQRSFNAYEALGDVRGKSLVAGNLSKFKLAAQEWDSAVYYGQLGIAHAETTNDRYLLSLGHERLAAAYGKLGAFERALFHDQKHDSLSELITSAEVQKNMDELHIQYETEKRERELDKERYAGQRKNFWLIASGAGIAALILALVLLFQSGQERKKRLLATARADLEAERNRISMDLHDHLGAELSVITSRLDTEAFRAGTPESQTQLTVLANQAREASAQLRETIWSVRKTEVTLEQLATRIREFAQRNLEGSGIDFRLERSGKADLTSGQGLDLFRVVQEAINNARKYSGGNHISLQITQEGTQLTLILRDNGRGFREASVAAGYGLANMRERIANLNGSISIQQAEGTQIRIAIPLRT